MYLWGIAGDIQFNKDFMEKCLLKKPTKVSFRGDSGTGSLSHRRRSTTNMDESQVIIEDLKLGE